MKKGKQSNEMDETDAENLMPTQDSGIQAKNSSSQPNFPRNPLLFQSKKERE